MEEKKPNKSNFPVFMVLLVILFLVGIGLGFAASKLIDENNTDIKVTKKEDKKKEEKEPVVTNYAVTDEKVKDLINNLAHNGVVYCQIIEIFANDKKVEAKNISNQMAYHIAEYSLMGGSYGNAKDSFTLDEVTSEIKKYLGKDYDFDPTAIDYKGFSCPQYNYDSATKTYNHQLTACGGTCGPRADYKMVKAVDTDGILKIDVKVIFASLDEGKDGMYSDYAKTNKIGTFEDNNQDVTRQALFEKGSDYQFTFKLEDGNYVFVSSEPVK